MKKILAVILALMLCCSFALLCRMWTISLQ